MRATFALVSLGLVDSFSGGATAKKTETGSGLYGDCGAGKKVEKDHFYDFGVDTRCGNRYASPSSWFPAAKGSYDFDLAVIGAGIQTAYLIDQLREKLGEEKLRKLNIGVFEAGNSFGGRVMSDWGPGMLGNSVNGGIPTQPMEYGAMRVDPNKHYLVWDSIEKIVKQENPEAVCKRSGTEAQVQPEDEILGEMFKDQLASLGTEGDCPEYMTMQYTSDLRFHTSDPDAGEFLLGATVDDDGAIQNECLSLGSFTYEYVIKNWDKEKQESTTTSEAVDEVCKPETCDKVADGFCDLCAKFPSPGLNMVSCIGYDDLPSVSCGTGLAEAQAVVGRGMFNCLEEIDGKPADTSRCSKLYFWLKGVQRYGMDLWYNQGKEPIGPNFNKKLVSIDFPGAAAAAAEQAKSVYNSKGNLKSETPTLNDPIELSFEDQSYMQARNVYLTVLPPDLHAIKNLEAWEKPVDEGMLPFGATKLFMAWQDGVPEAIAKATDNGKVRIVLDGKRPGQVARQFFMWDPNTVLVYQTAPAGDASLPANYQQEMAIIQGMTPMVDAMMENLQAAFGNITYPSWVRVKPWSAGSLSYYKSSCGTVQCENSMSFASRFSRPFGQDAPVFYGSSEMNGNGGNGWIQGSYEEVQLHLPALLERLEQALADKSSEPSKN